MDEHPNALTLLIVSIVATAILGLVGVVGATAAPASGPVSPHTTTTYSFTDASQTYCVPTGVHTVNVVALGAQGGPDGGGVNGGGLGGQAKGTVVVNPGDTLQVNVGGQGASAAPNGLGGSNAGAGGFNGGGSGGSNSYSASVNPAGGGGGGASDVVSGSTVLIVAGGGGGAGGGNSGYEGGAGGSGGGAGTGGSNGGLGMPPDATGGQAGGSGGAAGADTFGPNPSPATAGGLGTGGRGSGSGVFAGGGGGGGSIGGGGGGAAGGGAMPGGGGGGGGSSAGPSGTTFATGVQSGNGQISIEPSSGSCAGPGTSSVQCTKFTPTSRITFTPKLTNAAGTHSVKVTLHMPENRCAVNGVDGTAGTALSTSTTTLTDNAGACELGGGAFNSLPTNWTDTWNGNQVPQTTLTEAGLEGIISSRGKVGWVFYGPAHSFSGSYPGSDGGATSNLTLYSNKTQAQLAVMCAGNGIATLAITSGVVNVG
jgi:hypothetical protein